MATVAEIQAASDRLRTAVDNAVPVLQGARDRIDPAALDPVRDSLNATADLLIAATPAQ